MRLRLLVLFCLLAFTFNVYPLAESDLKTKAIAALDNVKNYTMDNNMEMRISTLNPSGENTFLFDQLMDSRSWVDFEKNVLRMEYVVNIKTKDKDQSVPGQAYVSEGFFYQKVGEQWFKRAVTDVDKEIFKACAQEKDLLSAAQMEIISQNPLYVVVVPDKNKVTQEIVYKMRALLGDKSGALNISVETMTFEYWFDDNYNIKKKRTLSRVKVSSADQPVQLIEESTNAAYNAYNQGVTIELPAAAQEAQLSPLK
jgi:hypothetical protein